MRAAVRNPLDEVGWQKKGVMAIVILVTQMQICKVDGGPIGRGRTQLRSIRPGPKRSTPLNTALASAPVGEQLAGHSESSDVIAADYVVTSRFAADHRKR